MLLLRRVQHQVSQNSEPSKSSTRILDFKRTHIYIYIISSYHIYMYTYTPSEQQQQTHFANFRVCNNSGGDYYLGMPDNPR